MNTEFSKLPKNLKIWVIVGFVFSLLYLVLAIYEFTAKPEVYEFVGTAGVVNCLLFGVGCLLVIMKKFSGARVCWLIGGIIGLPFGLVMIIGSGQVKKAAVSQTST
jgi:hypothetical protein